MKYRPLLLRQPRADEMVRAFLDGRKTQFRVPVKPQPDFCGGAGEEGDVSQWGWHGISREIRFLPVAESSPPLGTIGDRLWLKETFYWDEGSDKTIEQVAYRASTQMPSEVKAMGCRWTPSILMPRWASRIDLEITAVRVERVQDITDEDAMKEGCEMDGDFPKQKPHKSGIGLVGWDSPAEWFSDVWDSIYANWDANPWVFAYTVKRIKP